MKTKLFFAAMAAVAIVGCNKEVAETPAIADGEASFLSVNLGAAGTITRAPEDKFVYGTDNENAVETIHFYFFDAEGNAYAVQAGSNTIAWAKGTVANVEEVSDLVLVIKKSKDVPPAKMVAVLNAPKALQVESISLSDLEEAVTKSLTNENGKFIMTNSVYVDGLKNVINATEISGDNFFTTADELENVEPGDIFPSDVVTTPSPVDPVDVYVERVAAKVVVKTNEDNLYETGVDGIYAKVLGWEITNYTTEGNILKVVDANWTELGFSPWNNAAFHRSYWAATTATPVHNLTFNAVKANNPATYYFENTLPAGDGENVVTGQPTTGKNQTPQLLVAAQLVDEDEKPKEFAKWYDVTYEVEDVKVAMISSVASKLYKKTGVGEFTKIAPDDVELYQVSEETLDNRYEVKLMLADADEVYYSPVQAAEGEKAVPYTAEQVTAILESVSPAQVWTEGYTYYYTNIKHFGDATGMVRNHVYEVTISAITGLGTPVYNPGYIITPEEPEEQEALNIAAQINILSWHVVSQDVSLGK